MGRAQVVARLVVVAVVGLAIMPAAGVADHSGRALLSTGPDGGNGPFNVFGESVWGPDMDLAGRSVGWHTDEELVAGAGPGSKVYTRAGGTTSFVGPGFYRGMALDGSAVVFQTRDSVLPQDQDGGDYDYYRWSAGQLTLLSTGPLDDGTAQTLNAHGLSADARWLFFSTRYKLTSDDLDGGSPDLYASDGTTTRLMTTGPADQHGVASFTWLAASADGSRAYFATGARLTAGDTDSASDVYERAGGTTRLVSDENAITTAPPEPGPVVRCHTTVCGDHFFLTTPLTISPEDDVRQDVYDWDTSDGSLRFVSGPPIVPDAFTQDSGFAGASDDGSVVVFVTYSRLVPEDTDTTQDVYVRDGGTTRLASVAPGAGNGPHVAHLASVSADGAKVFFITEEQLLPTDSDAVSDLYQWSDGLLEHVSIGGNGPYQAVEAAHSRDGSRVFFSTAEPLTAEDLDDQLDLYERHAGVTHLITKSPTPSTVSGCDPWCSDRDVWVSDDGTVVVYATYEQVVAFDTDSSRDMYAAYVGPHGHPRPQGATPLYVPLVPAFQPCTAPNRTHGPPLAFGSCAPPVPGSPNLTVGSGGGTPALARSFGFVRFGVQPDPDVQIRFSLSNVMRVSDLSEYTGDLRATTQVRLTDRDGAGVSQTGQDLPLAFDVPCAPTAAAEDKSLCELVTTLDTLIPGAAVGATRAVWALDQVKVYDGGPDEDASTTEDNSLFAVQGVFVP